MLIRPRRADDVDALVGLGFEVRSSDTYPLYMPQRMDEFLVSEDSLDAWVAVLDGRVVGQIALHTSSAPEVMSIARRATGLEDRELTVIARFLVSPAVRRQGVGRALFETAWSEAVSRGLRAVLDVVVEHRAATELYRRSGWDEAGRVTWYLPDGSPLEELVFVSPDLSSGC